MHINFLNFLHFWSSVYNGTNFIQLLLFFQGELIVGDQSGAIHMWDLKTDHNEQLVSQFMLQDKIQNSNNIILFFAYLIK